MGCIFCERIAEQGVAVDGVVRFPDAFPVSPGHTLVVPARHVTDIFELPAGELTAVWREVGHARAELARTYSPQGFNIGVNIGRAAGQTVNHAHVHVIPRYGGDVNDPRGGVRWVLPERADYWSNVDNE